MPRRATSLCRRGPPIQPRVASSLRAEGNVEDRPDLPLDEEPTLDDAKIDLQRGLATLGHVLIMAEAVTRQA